MGYGKLRFAASFISSAAMISVLVLFVLSTQIAMSALPLMDVLGIGGLYLTADSFQGEGAQLYPVQGQDVGSGEIDADTPVCKQRPMLAIELNQAIVSGFEARKDIQLPHLEDRWMTINITQPAFSQKIYGDEITFYTTQLEVDQLDIRNIVIREGRPGPGASQSARISPGDQNIGEVTEKKFGPYSGEFYLEGGNSVDGDPGLEAQGANAWLHGVTGQGITFNSTLPSFFPGLELDVSFPLEGKVQNYYDGELGYSGPEANFRRDGQDKYFDCIPEEAQ